MTYSQINQPEGWGFSRRTPNLNLFLSSRDAVARYIAEQQGKDVFEYSIFGDATGQTKIGDFS